MRNWRPLMVTVTCDMTRPGDCRGCSTVMGLQHGTDRAHGGVEPLCDFPACVFERAPVRDRIVEIGGEPRPVVVERVDLGGEFRLAELGLALPLGRRLKGIKGKRQSLAGRVDRAGLGHRPDYPHTRAYDRDSSAVRRRKLLATPRC